MISRVDDWLSEARYELDTAKLLLENGRYSAACFYAQQSGEKAVKAALLHFKVKKAGHSILDLLKELNKYVKVPEDFMESAKALDRHFIPPRYPNAFERGAPHEYYRRKDAEEAVVIAEKTLVFVGGIVGKR